MAAQQAGQIANRQYLEGLKNTVFIFKYNLDKACNFKMFSGENWADNGESPIGQVTGNPPLKMLGNPVVFNFEVDN